MDENDDTQTSVYADVEDERNRQDEQWGGAAHDDTHSLADWLTFIERQTALARQEPTIAVARQRERLVKVAALAVAALESIDRRAAVPSGGGLIQGGAADLQGLTLHGREEVVPAEKLQEFMRDPAFPKGGH